MSKHNKIEIFAELSKLWVDDPRSTANDEHLTFQQWVLELQRYIMLPLDEQVQLKLIKD